MIRSFLTALTALAAVPALAHSGHGAVPGTHWLGQADHLIVIVLAVSASVLAVRRLLRSRAARARRLRHG